MKKIFTVLCLAIGVNYSQAQTEFSFVAADLIPHEDGYYLTGFDFDGIGNDGLEEHYQGCPGDVDYEDYETRFLKKSRCNEVVGPCIAYDLHHETGEQQGFTYHNCLILPVCDQKYTSELDPPLSQGYIQLRPGIDTSDLSLAYSYILSPKVSNIQSITMETSPEVHIQDSRRIPYIIEYSKDGGDTYVQDYFIADNVLSDGGYRASYTAETSADFAQMQTDSKTSDIVIRFITNPNYGSLGADKGQYVRVHKITIMADSATSAVGTLANSIDLKHDLIQIKNHTISVEKGSLLVYNLSGKFIGGGSSVALEKGLYIVTTSQGLRKKIFIQ